jgi:Glyoxalase-like domain
VRIDHVIYASGDLDAASARVERELGLAAVGGGRHEGIGTHNRIVPLDNSYIELLAIADPDEAATSDLGRAVQVRIDQVGDGLMGWAVVVDDVAPVAERLGTAVTTIAREGLSAHLTGLAEAMADPYLPFFIARDPGVLGSEPRSDVDGITWVEVAGDEGRLGEWLGGDELPVRVVDGHPPGVRAVGIGDRELRTG